MPRITGVVLAGETCLASASRRFVSPLIAEGTTTRRCPARTHLATRRATLWIRSGEPIEVPPYLWTIKAMEEARRLSARSGRRAGARKGWEANR